MLYCRDENTGEHVVTHEGNVMVFPTRQAALDAAHELLGGDTAAERRGSPVPN